ncbi:MAG: ribosome silencing factor [Dehalococcoidia bacterium]
MISKDFVINIKDFSQVVTDTAQIMSDQLLSNVVILDVSKQSDFFSYFIIASGMTTQHLQSSTTEISKFLKTNSLKINHREGNSNSGWVLLDFPGLVIHLFLDDQREKYDLESLWSKSSEILRIL